MENQKVQSNHQRRSRIILFGFMTVLLVCNGLWADIIIDNRDPQTALVGSWPVSGGLNPYGIDSVYARNPNLSFSWLFTPSESGQYELSMWWTEFSSRSSTAPVEIQHASGTAFMTVNQLTNGGIWNVLGQYSFNAGTTYRVTIRTLTDNSSISADAVRFVKLFPSVETVIDNRDPQTALVGSWPISGGLNPYGIDSVFARNPNLSFSWLFTPSESGQYELSMWWTEFSSRSSTAPVEIQHAFGTAFMTVNQLTSGGMWNVLGQYSFNAGTTYRVTIRTLADNSSISADAVRFVKLPSSTIVADFEATPTSGSLPLTVNFTDLSTGIGTIDTWEWDFTDDGIVDSTLQNPVFVYSTAGQYSVRLTVSGPDGSSTILKDDLVTVIAPDIPVEVIIDNRDAAISTVGTWPVSGAVGFYGTDSVYARNANLSFSWLFTPDQSGTYDVSMWWTEFTSRSNSAPVEIHHAGGTAAMTVNQLANGGKWNLLGQYNFNAGTTYRVTIRTKTDNTSISADAVRFGYVDVPSSADTEHVYVCFGYGSERVNYQWEDMLVNIGAIRVDDLWFYTNPSTNKSFVIHTVNSIEGMHEAMKTPNSHILFYGHSNYGVGAIFPTSTEQRAQVINELYYMDDDRIFNYSTDTVAVSVSGMVNSQAYPNWYPVFKDGTSAVAPYNFGDPRGNPPHNYYLTYQVPGDPTYYKIETPRTPALTRFPDSGRPAWYSSTGALPNPSISLQQQYFIRNTEATWEPPFEATAGWLGSTSVAGYYGSNYLWTNAGNGDTQAHWYFTVPRSGEYNIAARWAASSGRTTAAPYTVNHVLGDTTVLMNQRINGGAWNSLGTYNFKSIQGWYESRNNVPTLLTLNQTNIGGNNTKKAAFAASLSGNAYLTQAFSEPRSGNVRLEWDIYMDNILNDSTRDRGGMMLVGTDVGSGPNQGSGRFVYMAFWCVDGGGSPGDGKTMTLVAREPGDSSDLTTQWRQVATGFEFDRWYKVAVQCDTNNFTYDVYVDDVLVQTGVMAYNSVYELTHISFAQWSDGAGAFFVDNVYGDTPDMVVDNTFNDSANSTELRARDTQRYYVSLTNNVASGNVIADAVLVAHASNPPVVLQPDFFAATRSGTAPLDVRFSSLATGDLETRTWDFGDGTPTVKTTSTSIAHNYQYNGTYSVRMTGTMAGGSASITKTNYITVGAATPKQVEFSASSREGTAPRTVSFADRSSGGVKSVLWKFGDGATSTSNNPSYTYALPGNYEVTLTVTFTDNSVQTLIKPNFVRAIVYQKYIDNINYPPYHYGSKTILMRGPLEINPAEMKYKRMFILSCNSGDYYLQTLGRGVVFYSLDDTAVNPGTGFSIYLRAYMLGQSNQQILNALLAKQAAFDFYDFTKRPQDQ